MFFIFFKKNKTKFLNKKIEKKKKKKTLSLTINLLFLNAIYDT